MWCRVLPALALLASLLVAGCNEPAMPPLLIESVAPYTGSWEYRYGDSPHTASGELSFAQPNHQDGGWRPTKSIWSPPGRKGQRILWVRTRLTGDALFDPVLYSRSADYTYEAYLDGKLVLRMGDVPPSPPPRIGGTAPLLLRLPTDFAGHMLSIRLYSKYRTIGLLSPILVGGRLELLLYLAKKDFNKPLISLVLISFALVGLLTYFVRRREKAFLYFFGFSATIGVFVGLSRNPSRYLLSGQASMWWAIELSSLCLIGFFLCGFFDNVFGPGPWQLSRRFKWVFAAFFVIAVGMVALGIAPAMVFLDYLQMLLLAAILYLAIYCVVNAWLGNVDARIFGAGFFLATIPVIYDLLTSLQVLPGDIDSAALSSLIIVSTLIILLSRRFLALNRRLLNLSALLQLNLAAASQLDEVQQAQIGLTQVHKLLPVGRSTLFLFGADHQELQWVSSRDDSGPLTQEPPEAERSLAQAVIARGRSVSGRAVSAPQDGAGATEQPMLLGMPLRAQGQLIGVLAVELRPALDELSGDDGELLAWLCNQLGLSMMTSRALRLEVASELDRRRLAEQGELLAAAARMAGGDLASPIVPVSGSDLSSLAEALETMRRDLQVKFHTLQEYNREIHELNEELRHQIDQRSRRVLDLALKREDQRATRKAHYVPGALLGQDYSVVRLLGQGTMGSVYEVKRTADGRHLAAKVLTPRADQLTMVRFAREAQLLARLKHPNLIGIVDIDVTESGVLFLVMELIAGTTLKLCRDKYGNLRFVLPVLRQIADGLAAIHAAGIVHRDLKPANVLIAGLESAERPPLVKLVDFGISTLAAGESKPGDPKSTGQQAVGSVAGSIDPSSISAVAVGTPMYMAPESGQRGHRAHPAADIWSFGVLAYEVLTSELPFALLTQASEEPVSVSALGELRADLPPALASLLQRCLHSDPAQRPSAEALAIALSCYPTAASGRSGRDLLGST